MTRSRKILPTAAVALLTVAACGDDGPSFDEGAVRTLAETKSPASVVLVVKATREMCSTHDELALRIVFESNPAGWEYVRVGCPERASAVEGRTQ